MTKTARVALALSLALPLLASQAEPPGSDAPADADWVGSPGTPVEPPPELPTPEELAALPLEEQNALIDKFLAAERAAGKEMIVVRSTVEPVPVLPHGLCLARGGSGEDLCAAARRISHQRPCLASGDCPALEEWRRVMGEPGVRPAPRWTVQAAERRARPAEPPDRD